MAPDGGLGTTSYAYDLAGNRTKVLWKDGHAIDYTYDVTGAMKTVTENPDGASNETLIAAYAYDDLGRRASLTRYALVGGVSTAVASTVYGFDDLSRLDELNLNLAGAGSGADKDFAYNQAAQITTQSVSNAAFVWPETPDPLAGARVFNPLNQNTSAGGGTVSPITYDDNGNLTNDETRSYTYDLGNRLTGSNTVPASTAATLTYDALDRLIQVQVGAGTPLRMVYDGAEIAAEFNTAGGYPFLRRYVKGAAPDETLVWYEGAAFGAANRRHLIADERGSVAAVTDSAGVKLAINTYDEYGRPATDSATNAARIRYTGQYWLSEIGLYYYKARFYSPTLQRFMQADPIGYGGGMNLYAYVGGDPVNFIDPLGLKRVCWDTYYFVSHTVPSPDGRSEVTTLRRVKNTLQSCAEFPDSYNNPEVGPIMDSLQPTEHDYGGIKVVACSAAQVAEFLRQPGNSAPNAPAAAPGTIFDVRLRGGFLITQYVSDLAIANVTQQGHIFSDGYVLLNTTPLLPNLSSVTMSGSGTNRTAIHAVFNIVVGEEFFSEKLDELADYFSNIDGKQ